MMMTEMSLIRNGITLISVTGDVSGQHDDLLQLCSKLMTEFRKKYPNASILDGYNIKWEKSRETEESRMLCSSILGTSR